MIGLGAGLRVVVGAALERVVVEEARAVGGEADRVGVEQHGLVRVEEARLAELEVVIQEVRNRIAEYGLTASQIFGRPGGPGKRGARGTVSEPRYRDPKTGATWNGRGREPGWIKGGRRERFLIERNAG